MRSSLGIAITEQRSTMITRLDRFQARRTQSVGAGSEPQQVNEATNKGLKLQVTQEFVRAQRQVFPSESPVNQFRGDITGREVGEVEDLQELSNLPKQVRPFDPSLSSTMISSFNPAERAAIGALKDQTQEDPSQKSVVFEKVSEGIQNTGPSGSLASIDEEQESFARKMITTLNPAELLAIDATPNKFIIDN